jgi:hypothetical protein
LMANSAPYSSAAKKTKPMHARNQKSMAVVPEPMYVHIKVNICYTDSFFDKFTCG